MLSSHFYPSYIEDEIYGIMEDYEVEGIDLYDEGVVSAIADFFACHPSVEFHLCCSPWPDETGGVCAISFVENNHPHLVVFDYKK